jgi:hypothetical protein
MIEKIMPSSQGFDVDFNYYAMLVTLIAAMGGAVGVLRHMHNKVTLNRLWGVVSSEMRNQSNLNLQLFTTTPIILS